MTTKVFNCNTDLCVDLKTFLLNDRITKLGKCYTGVLRRDSEDHYDFRETLPPTAYKRNPRLFNGRYITVTCRADGSLHLNFKNVVMDDDFSVDSFAIGVCNELRQALGGLVEEE